MLDKIMLSRPGGHGESKLLERNPLYSEYNDKKHYSKAFLICIPLFLIGLIPLMAQIGIVGDSIDVEMRIYEGAQATINNILISGNDRTNEHVIRRELRTLPGKQETIWESRSPT